MVKNQIKNKNINIRYYIKNKQQYIIVKDNAGGINNKNKEKIFQPYFTGNSLSKSRGLGLYIAKMLIEESLNGQISVSNNEQGAVFTLVLQ